MLNQNLINGRIKKAVMNFRDSHKIDNPFNSKITIRCIESDFQNAYFEVCNLIGEIKLTGTLIGTVKTLDLSNLPSGVYFVTIISGEMNFSRKVIKT